MGTRERADKIEMQHRLFAQLSAMFGREVPLYQHSLLVNRVCNRAACDLLSRQYRGFSITDEQLERTSGERHGAIRIGTREEYKWIGRFFAQFAMEPHNFYDMTSVGRKSQPVIATAFRSSVNPEHRVFTSLLMIDYFDPATAARIDELLARRRVISDNAKRLIELGERDGGLAWADADELIHEATTRIFKWTGKAHGHSLYRELCAAGFKIAADIACFERHHLNHLTPNSLCIDLFAAAMKFCMEELTEAEFRARSERFLSRMLEHADRDAMRLLFRHLSVDEINGYAGETVSGLDVASAADTLVDRLKRGDAQLAGVRHAGFKDFTEGPSENTPVLLRQDAYKALTEPVLFCEDDGSVFESEHTARFGEIEQRAYATTPKGRELYVKCLDTCDALRDRDPTLIKRDFMAYESQCAAAFAPFPKSLSGLLDAGLVHGLYSATQAGIKAGATIDTTDVRELVRRGHARVDGLRYEDFLPVSAAGIFASNLCQYGTKSTAAVKPTYTKAMLEAILGQRIIDVDAEYTGLEARSILRTYEDLGLTPRAPQATLEALRNSVRIGVTHRAGASDLEPAKAG